MARLWDLWTRSWRRVSVVLWQPGISRLRVSSGPWHNIYLELIHLRRSRSSRNAVRHEIYRPSPSRPEKDYSQHPLLHLQDQRHQGLVPRCYPSYRSGHLADRLHGFVCRLRQGCVSRFVPLKRYRITDSFRSTASRALPPNSCTQTQEDWLSEERAAICKKERSSGVFICYRRYDCPDCHAAPSTALPSVASLRAASRSRLVVISNGSPVTS